MPPVLVVRLKELTRSVDLLGFPRNTHPPVSLHNLRLRFEIVGCREFAGWCGLDIYRSEDWQRGFQVWLGEALVCCFECGWMLPHSADSDRQEFQQGWSSAHFSRWVLRNYPQTTRVNFRITIYWYLFNLATTMGAFLAFTQKWIHTVTAHLIANSWCCLSMK
jgi:hypothetical protein